MTIEDSLRGHFLRTFKRRIAKARGAELSIEVADLQLLLDLVEPLDAEIRELRERPTWTDDPERDASYRISFLNALDVMGEVHPGLLEGAGTLHEAIRWADARSTRAQLCLLARPWLDAAKDTVPSEFIFTPDDFAELRKDTSYVLADVERIESANPHRLRIRGKRAGLIVEFEFGQGDVEHVVRRSDDEVGECTGAPAVGPACITDPRPIKIIDDPTNPGQKIRI